MIIEAAQSFTLPFAGTPQAALAFVRDPARALSRLTFLRGLQADPQGVRGELLVPLPVLGEVDLPFHSLLDVTGSGATLTPMPLDGERAWVEVAGVASVPDVADIADVPATSGAAQPPLDIAFQFHFRAHLATPQADGWGGAAFEKMVRAAATRTLERLSRELPAGLQAALSAQP